jgi:hypothetical protein
VRDDAAIKLAAQLADDFDASTFSKLSGQSESDAATTLNGLVGRGWLEATRPGGAGGQGGSYRVTASGRAGAL